VEHQLERAYRRNRGTNWDRIFVLKFRLKFEDESGIQFRPRLQDDRPVAGTILILSLVTEHVFAADWIATGSSVQSKHGITSRPLPIPRTL
jgi:hypothetical protein